MSKKRVAAILDRIVETHGRHESSDDDSLPFVDTIIAITLSQNTNDVNSHKAYVQLRSRFPDWSDALDATEENVEDAIRVAGLAKQKAGTIRRLLARFVDRFGDFELEGIDEIGDDELLDWLVETKGIGLKTASCAMMFALGRDLCAVDTHLHRVLNRIGILSASTPDRTFTLFRPLVPPGRAHEIHVALIRFGRHTCKARTPHCFDCPVYADCRWPERKRRAAEGREGARAVSGDFLITDGI